MKMSFSPPGRQQEAVSPEQVEVRLAVPPRNPAVRITVVVLVVLTLLIAVVWWWRSLRVYTYGVITTGMEAFHAPVRSRILSVYVEPGDRIKADQALYLLVSEDAAAEMKESQELLAQESRKLEVALAQEQSLFEDPIQELRDLDAANLRIKFLEADAARQALRRQSEAIQLEAEASAAENLAQHLQGVATQRRSQLERIMRLAEADAATPDQVRLAEEAVNEVTYSAEAAQDTVNRLQAAAKRAAVLSEAEEASLENDRSLAQGYLAELQLTYADARGLRVKERTRGIENIRSRITSLESRTAHLRTLAGPTEIRSLADGVVTEVLASEGSNIPKDGMILTVAGTGKVWINAFVAPERATEVVVGDDVMVYPTTGSKPLRGKVTASGGIQYKVHASLRTRITDISAVYVRIDLDEVDPELIPGNVASVVIK